MIARTEAEQMAYVEGYDACYKQFCECLSKKPFVKAMAAMAWGHAAVCATVEQEEEGEKPNDG